MAGFSTAYTDAILSFILRSGALPKPTMLYFSLHTADPTDAVIATELAIGSVGYARAAIAPLDANFAPPATLAGKRTVSNAVNVAYGLPTGNWGGGAGVLLTHAGVWDAASGGTMLLSGTLSIPRTVLSTDNSATFGPGSLVFTLD
jgi:hypothetical protein